MAELRIVAGKWRGRRIKVPPTGVRPTADRVRESWMSIVNPYLADSRVLDLCAGSGALGLEALSRGAVSCEFVEKDPKVARILEENIATLGAGVVSRVQRTDAVEYVSQLPTPDSQLPLYEIAFADPPYRMGIAESLASRWLHAPFATIFCIEHEASLTLPPLETGDQPDRRVYGDTALTIYRKPD